MAKRCGAPRRRGPGTHLLSVLAHRLGLTLTQQAVAAKTNEMKEVETVLRQIVLTGRVVTRDALLTQRQVAQTIVDAGGDSVMIVKENQPQLKADIDLVFTLPPAGDRQESVRTVDVGHGRIETRNLTTSGALGGTAIGRGWHKCSKWDGMSSLQKREQSGSKWSMGSPVRAPSERHLVECWSWCAVIGRLRTSRTGYAMRPSIYTARRCAVATSRK